jgi:hypothetical protein
MPQGTCPYCSKETTFREFTFGENVTGLLSYGLKWLAKPTAAKVSEAVEIGGSLATSGSRFENFICNACNGKVHTCGGCKAILRYQDTGTVCPHCGYH